MTRTEILNKHSNEIHGVCFNEIGSHYTRSQILQIALDEVLSLCEVIKSLPNKDTAILKIRNNLKEINEDKKITSIDFDLGYSLGFFDGMDY